MNKTPKIIPAEYAKIAVDGNQTRNVIAGLECLDATGLPPEILCEIIREYYKIIHYREPK